MKFSKNGNPYDKDYATAARIFIEALIQKGCYTYIALDQVYDALEARQRDAQTAVRMAIMRMKQDGVLTKTATKSIYAIAKDS